jgi:MFS family permease
MGAVAILSLGLMMLLGLPTITFFYAKHLGRKPWPWFLIGIILPGIATIILSFLPDLSEDKKEQL